MKGISILIAQAGTVAGIQELLPKIANAIKDCDNADAIELVLSEIVTRTAILQSEVGY